MKIKLKAGHTACDEWILAPISDIITPKNGRICYCDRWWFITENDEVLFFRSYSSPICNSYLDVMNKLGNNFNPPNITLKITPKFIETAFIPHSCDDYH